MTFGVQWPTLPSAFAAAMLTLLAVLALAERGGGLRSSNLLIAGMILSAILSSAISFLKMLSGENVSAIVYWMMGSLANRRWSELALLCPIVLLGVGVAVCFARDLNALTLGDDAARALGVPVTKTRLILLLCGAMTTAACVSVGGIIGFVGLVVPHILRLGVSNDNRRLLPLSALAGALLLLLADDAARLIGQGDIPVGVLTTLLGGPFFLALFLRRGKLR